MNAKKVGIKKFAPRRINLPGLFNYESLKKKAGKWFSTRVARFFLVQHTKTGKNTYTK
jgi:hypothetical protein